MTAKSESNFCNIPMINFQQHVDIGQLPICYKKTTSADLCHLCNIMKTCHLPCLTMAE